MNQVGFNDPTTTTIVAFLRSIGLIVLSSQRIDGAWSKV